MGGGDGTASDMSDHLSVAGYDVELLIQGFPGKSNENGGLGWSAVVLLRGHGRIVLVDTGSFSARKVLLKRLAEHGIAREDVTDLLLTHAHYDHMMNWTLFPNASIALGQAELAWALQDPIEDSLCAELYVRELARSPQLRLVNPGTDILPGIECLEMPGHTPHHLVFVIDDDSARLIIAADAVKNRAELLCAAGVSTLDAGTSARSIERIAALWREREGCVLIAGHDLPMRNERGQPAYIGTRRAGITAWFNEDVGMPTKIHLDRNEGRASSPEGKVST